MVAKARCPNSVSVYYLAVRTIVLLRHRSNLARPVIIHDIIQLGPNYTCRQINLYRMFFADFSVNYQPIFMKFCMAYLRVTRRLQ